VKIFKTSLMYLPFSLNLGMHYCCGKYIARMDVDDYSYPHRIEAQVAYLEHNPDVGLVGSAYYLFDESNKVTGSIKKPLGDSAIRRLMYFCNPIAHPTVMFRRAAVEKIGGYPMSIFGEDYALWVKLILTTNWRVCNLDQCLIKYRNVSLGDARYNLTAYITILETQFSALVKTLDPGWIVGMMYTLLKIATRLLLGNLKI